MKKLLVLLVGVVATLAVVGQASAAKPFTHATGGVTLADPTQNLSFNAFDYGTTGDRGQVTYANPGAGVSYTASVFCANVDPATNTALFAYQIPPGNGGLSGLYIVWKVVDGGTPGTNGDTAGFVVPPDQASATAACNNLATGVTNYAITDGNLVVHG